MLYTTYALWRSICATIGFTYTPQFLTNSTPISDAHRSLSFELDILLEDLPVSSRGYFKAAAHSFLSYFIIGAHYHALQLLLGDFFTQGKMFFCPKWVVYYGLDSVPLGPIIICVARQAVD
jgi:hypothetical protein